MQTEKEFDAGSGKINNRRLYLINPRFQLAFMGYMVAICAVAVTIFYGANLYFFWDFTRTGQSLGLPADHVFFQFLNNQRQTMNQIFAFTSALCFITLTLGGLVFSHRVAGPLYRLHKHMRSVALGETKAPVSFRKQDYFLELADSFNAQLAYLKDGKVLSPADEAGSERDTKAA